MKLTTCKSSQLAEHGYDPTTKTMAVRFKSGGLYHYADVPPEDYEKFVKSESLGTFLHKHIKGKFAFKKQ